MPCRSDSQDGNTVTSAANAEFWGVYINHRRFLFYSADDAVAYAIYDLKGAQGRWTVHCGYRGDISRTDDIDTIADEIATAIHDDIEAENLERRCDEFDDHPLAEVFQAFCRYTNRDGIDQAEKVTVPPVPVETWGYMRTDRPAKYYVATYGDDGLQVQLFDDPLAYGRAVSTARRDHDRGYNDMGEIDSYTNGDCTLISHDWVRVKT